MLPKEDRRAMLLRLYNEDTPLMDHSKDRFHNNAKSQTSADVKDEPDDSKDEGADAHVKDELAAVKYEGGGEDVAAAGLAGDVETVETGAEDGDGDVERQDDVLSDAVKDEVEDGV